MVSVLTDRTAVCAMHDVEGAVILDCHISPTFVVRHWL